MHTLSPVDAAFLRMETPRSPMHVGALMRFELPPRAPKDFIHRLLSRMREHPFMPEPFGCRLSNARPRQLRPRWVPTEVDMDYHLRHSALPKPGGERELGVLVERLHSHPLDLHRPLWEAHVIEGLVGNRFAIYFKAHHCAIDGIGAVRMVQQWLSADPDDTRVTGPWMLGQKAKEPEAASASPRERLAELLRNTGEQVRSLGDLARGVTRMTRGEDSPTRGSLSTPRSVINVPVSPQRRLGTQLLSLDRLRAIAAQTEGTVNDVLLAIVGGALRRYLLEMEALPERSLLGSVPMALPRPDGKAGNAVAGFVCPLGTHLADPQERIAMVRRVTRRAKAEMSQMSAVALDQLALLGISPLLLGQMLGVLPKLPPIFNLVVSNVVLSKTPLYLMGARLEAMYPVSFLFDGYALNVTLVGYGDQVAVGFLGCRNALPRLQRLAIYTAEELEQMERVMKLKPPEEKTTDKAKIRKSVKTTGKAAGKVGVKTSAATKAKTKVGAKAKTKAKPKAKATTQA